MRRPNGPGIFLLVMGLSLLVGCGFQPLYGVRDNGARPVEHALAQVRILPIADRPGQILHNHLRDLFNPLGQPGKPEFFLEVTVTESIKGLGVQRDATATRSNLTVRAAFVLRDRDGKKVLFRGRSNSTNSFDVLDLEIQYSTLVSEEDARNRGLRQVAQSIKSRVAVYIRRNEG